MFSQATPILVFGGGTMGSALVKGWRAAGLKVSDIIIIEANAERLSEWKDAGYYAYNTLEAYTGDAPRTMLVAIKPQQFTENAASISKWMAGRDPLVISIMAGLSLAHLRRVLNTERLARVMPNTPALVGQGMSVACAPHLIKDDIEIVSALFGCVGKVAWLKDEAHLHAATAISGCGPAYVFAMQEQLKEAALKLGLSDALADMLVRQTLFGAAHYANESLDTFEKLRADVTSPNGVTEAALKPLLDAHRGLPALLRATTLAADARSREMEKKLV